MMHYWGRSFGTYPGLWGGGIIGIIINSILLLMIIFLFLSLIRGWRKHGWENYSSEKTSGRAEEILKERYAKGEIDKKQFEEMKKDIKA